MHMEYRVYDVFARERFSGNQLALFPDAAHIPPALMQQLACEMNYAESVFIIGTDGAGSHRYRIFTAKEELPFAGHPTLGAAYYLFTEVYEKTLTRLNLLCAAGTIPVWSEGALLWMRQGSARFGAALDKERVAPLIGLAGAALHSDYPCLIVNTGIPFLIVAVRSLLHLLACRHTHDQLIEFCAKIGVTGIMAFSCEPRDNSHDIATRALIAENAVPEDPATGSATGCLAAYLLYTAFGALASPDGAIRKVCGQGYEIGRPSHLHIHAYRDSGGELIVNVGGEVKAIASGRIL